jgi:hypothetical protein
VTRREFPGGWYIDALPTGEYCVLVKGAGIIDTHLGPLALPSREPSAVLFLTISNAGGFKFAGQAQSSTDPAAYEYLQGTGWRAFPPPACGTNPLIYDNAGVLHRSDCSIGSQGFRYVDESGNLVTGDQSIFRDVLPGVRLHEFTVIDNLLVGQGQEGGVLVWDGGALRILHPGNCFNIRVRRVGNSVSIAFYTVAADGLSAHIYTGQLDELRALPLVPVDTPNPAPAPPPPAPVPSPVPSQPEPQPMPTPSPTSPVPFSWDTVAIIGDAPDVRAWAETTHIRSLTVDAQGVGLVFEAQSRWPDTLTPGWDGALQYTLWVAEQIGGRWYATGAIEFWRGLARNGGDITRDDQIRRNWVYFADPMAGHSVAPGERIGMFVTAGDQRRKDVHAVQERSNIVFFELPSGAAAFTFGVPVAAPAQPPVQEQPAPVPNPVTPPPLAPPIPPVVDTAGEAALLAKLDEIKAAIQAASVAEIAKLDEVKVAFIKGSADVGKQIVAALTAGGGGGALGSILGSVTGKKK